METTSAKFEGWAIEEREETLSSPKWDDSRLLPAGAVYAMNPATEAAVRAAVAQSEHREIKVISLPESAQLEAGSTKAEDFEDCEDIPEGYPI